MKNAYKFIWDLIEVNDCEGDGTPADRWFQQQEAMDKPFFAQVDIFDDYRTEHMKLHHQNRKHGHVLPRGLRKPNSLFHTEWE